MSQFQLLYLFLISFPLYLVGTKKKKKERCERTINISKETAFLGLC